MWLSPTTSNVKPASTEEAMDHFLVASIRIRGAKRADRQGHRPGHVLEGVAQVHTAAELSVVAGVVHAQRATEEEARAELVFAGRIEAVADAGLALAAVARQADGRGPWLQIAVAGEDLGAVLADMLDTHRAFDPVGEALGALRPTDRYAQGQEGLRTEVTAMTHGEEVLVVGIGQRRTAQAQGEDAVGGIAQVPVDTAAQFEAVVRLDVVAQQYVCRTIAVGAEFLVVVAQFAAHAVGRDAAPLVAGARIARAGKGSHTVGDRPARNTHAVAVVGIAVEGSIEADTTNRRAVDKAHGTDTEIRLEALLLVPIGHGDADAVGGLRTDRIEAAGTETRLGGIARAAGRQRHRGDLQRHAGADIAHRHADFEGGFDIRQLAQAFFAIVAAYGQPLDGITGAVFDNLVQGLLRRAQRRARGTFAGVGITERISRICRDTGPAPDRCRYRVTVACAQA